MEKSEGENNIVCSGWMAQGKHGRNNTIESRLLIKAGNLAELVPARRAPSAEADMSSSDLHHSSPRARISRALTPHEKPLPVNYRHLAHCFQRNTQYLGTSWDTCWCTCTDPVSHQEGPTLTFLFCGGDPHPRVSKLAAQSKINVQ